MPLSSSQRPGNTERGRPREFDPEVAIAAAARVFWDKGYRATSVEDLCESTGLLRGSLYGAFGDKKGMLLAALDQYAEKNLARLAESLSSPEPSREVLRSALLYYTRSATVPAGRHGCLVTNTALEMLPRDPDVAERVERIFRRMASLLAAAVIRGQAAGIFNPDLNEREVGDFLLCVILGLRVLGKTRSHESAICADGPVDFKSGSDVPATLVREAGRREWARPRAGLQRPLFKADSLVSVDTC
jgi:TetR/AcrR family transcriptional regulator, transcriptional repressor for nem operon